MIEEEHITINTKPTPLKKLYLYNTKKNFQKNEKSCCINFLSGLVFNHRNRATQAHT